MYNENIDLEEDNEPSNGFDFKGFYDNNKKLIWLLLGILIFIIFVSMITSCGRTSNNDGGSQNSTEEPLLVMNNKNEIITIGSSRQISASVTNYPNAFIMYSSQDENIATVSSNGLVTGKGLGTTNIYAVYIHNGNKVLRDECLVTVTLGSDTAKVTSINFPSGDLIMGVGKTFDLSDKLVINPYNGYIYQKHFESKDNNVVKVDSNGLVKAIGVGTTYINVSINNIFETKIRVMVVNKDINSEIVEGPTSINVSSELIKLKISQTKKIDYSMNPSSASVNSLTWTSSDPMVATVNNNGEVTGIKEGSSTITVSSSNGVSSKVVVEVSQYGDDTLIESITYSPNTISLSVGSTYSITPVISPSNATNKTLTFTSSNSSVASVSSVGGVSAIVTANSVGTATITFQSSNGKQGSVTINVTGNNNNGYYDNNYNNNYNYDNGSSGSSSSSSNSSSSSTNTAKYAKITTSTSNISILSSSYTTFKIKANLAGTFDLSTSRAEIYFPSSQSRSIKVSADKEVTIRVNGSKSTSSSVTGYIIVKFTPSDSSIKHTYVNIPVTIK